MIVKIGEEDRGFSFGTHTFRIIREVSKVDSIEEVFEKLTNEKKELSLTNHIDFICTFLFCCARHYNESQGKEIDFKIVNVSDWMDELGLGESMKLVLELIKVYTEKNLKASAMGQLEQV